MKSSTTFDLPDPDWEGVRSDIKANRHLLCMPGRAAAPGTLTIELYHLDIPSPIGIVWFGFAANRETIEVFSSWVNEAVRRCGVRSAIHRSMLAYYPTIRRLVSQHGTPDGAAWMSAVGYRQSATGWEFVRSQQ